MTTSFRILVHRNEDSLHLKLMGDFDITSVREIFRALEHNGRRISNVFIHTGCLTGIRPNARGAFFERLQLFQGSPFRFIFTGRFSDTLSAEENRCAKTELLHLQK